MRANLRFFTWRLVGGSSCPSTDNKSNYFVHPRHRIVAFYCLLLRMIRADILISSARRFRRYQLSHRGDRGSTENMWASTGAGITRRVVQYHTAFSDNELSHILGAQTEDHCPAKDEGDSLRSTISDRQGQPCHLQLKCKAMETTELRDVNN